MNAERTTTAERIASFPKWIQDVLAELEEPKQKLVNHEAWRRMREGVDDYTQKKNFFVGFWPLIQNFPHYMAMNLLKTTFGRDEGINAARSWLAKNLRIEQKHAEWFVEWAEAYGVSRDEVLSGSRLVEMTALSDWCWQVSHSGELPEAMAATNYAIEGVTGEWTVGVANSKVYEAGAREGMTETGMRWLRAHADYDDTHPWEALHIIALILGKNPPAARVRSVRDAIRKSYNLYQMSVDVGLAFTHDEVPSAAVSYSAAALS